MRTIIVGWNVTPPPTVMRARSHPPGQQSSRVPDHCTVLLLRALTGHCFTLLSPDWGWPGHRNNQVSLQSSLLLGPAKSGYTKASIWNSSGKQKINGFCLFTCFLSFFSPNVRTGLALYQGKVSIRSQDKPSTVRSHRERHYGAVAPGDRGSGPCLRPAFVVTSGLCEWHERVDPGKF